MKKRGLFTVLAIFASILVLGSIIAPNLFENLLLTNNNFISWQTNLTETNTTHGVRLFLNSTGYYNSTSGGFTSLVFYNSSSLFWNLTTSQADTLSTASGIVNNKNEINLSHPNLVSYWDLDSFGIQTNPYKDERGINNGTPLNGVINTTGLSSNAMSFDGINDWMNITGSSFFLINNFSLSLWVKPASLGNYHMLISTLDGSGGDYKGFELRINNDNKTFFIDGNGTAWYYVYTPQLLARNLWYHLSVTKNSTGRYIYINGNLSVSDANTTNVRYNTTRVYSLALATRPTPTSYFFNGTLDEVLIYNSSLRGEEVNQLYKSGLSQHAEANISLQTRVAASYNLSDPSLVGLYGFNDDNATTVFDEKGRANGTRQGSILDATERNGTVGKGYYFDGSNDYISTSVTNNYYPFSISIWLRRKASSTLGLIGNYQSFAYNGWQIYQVAAGYGFYYYKDSSNYLSVGYYQGNGDTSNWHHLVYIANESGLSAYWDGAYNTTFSWIGSSKGVPTTSNTMNIGRFGGSTGNYFNGNLDEIRIYNKSLNAAEVADLYNLGSYHLNWNSWSDEGTCYDNKTLILTEKGWKLFSELSREEKVATLNPDLGEIEYHLPSAYQVYESPGFMYRIKTSEGDLVVSSEHKLYSGKVSKNKIGFKTIFLVIGILILVFSLAGLIKLKFFKKNGF